MDNENLSDNEEIAGSVNNFFNNGVNPLHLQCDPEHLNDVLMNVILNNVILNT